MGLIISFLEELRNKGIAVSVYDPISSDDSVMLVIDSTDIPCSIEIDQDQEYMDIFAQFLYEDESAEKVKTDINTYV